MMIDFSQPNWKQYEDLIHYRFLEKYPAHSFERNAHLIGRLTQTSRQIDIAIKGEFLGHELFVVVDCKHYSTNIDVKEVESFIGLLEDVGADFGILVTNKGYSKAAIERAKRSRVKLDIVEYDDLDTYYVMLDYCEECYPGEEHAPGTIFWHASGVQGDTDKVAKIGRCDWCDSIHVQCATCNAVTGIPEALYDENVECSGGCETGFVIRREYQRHGEYVEILEVGQIEDEHQRR